MTGHVRTTLTMVTIPLTSQSTFSVTVFRVISIYNAYTSEQTRKIIIMSPAAQSGPKERTFYHCLFFDCSLRNILRNLTKPLILVIFRPSLNLLSLEHILQCVCGIANVRTMLAFYSLSD